jgi:hypothetical protein
MKRFYIYRIEEKYTKEFYWGSRVCKCDPKNDKYMGSMMTWKPVRKNLIKTNIIEYDTFEQIQIAERIVIDYYWDKHKFPLNRNYNRGGFVNMYGIKTPEETRKKISESLKGKNTWSRGKNLSIETRKKISEANCGENNGFFGKIHSEETRKKMSKPHQMSEKGSEAISNSNKTRFISEETRQKYREALSRRNKSGEIVKAKNIKKENGNNNL